MLEKPQMVRTASHVEDEMSHDSSSPTNIMIKGVDKKVNALRSKHSETEQRRRSKINERFQILRELIPENDKKRDKASFLLEVIQYVQFLQEKLQMYEGSCQGWSPESTKCLPLRMNSGPVESFVEQSQFDRNFYGHEDNILHPTLLSNEQIPMESDLPGATLCKSTDNLPMTTQDLHLDMPLQPAIFEGMTGQPHRGSFPGAEQLNQQSQSHFWLGRSCGDDCSFPVCAPNVEELRSESGEAGVSNVYSQGLLSCLKDALQSSGVDLSQANISVQLDVGRQANSRSTSAIFNMKGQENSSGVGYGSTMDFAKNYEHPQKRFRADET